MPLTAQATFADERGLSSRAIAENRFIIEAKSANGNGTADRILWASHQHSTKHCSKYCAGVAPLDEEPRHNRFLTALRKLGTLPETERMACCIDLHGLRAMMTIALTPAGAASAVSEVKVLGSIDSPAEGMNGYRIEELSGLAWDADEKLLYAVSDRGVIHHSHIGLDGNRITQMEVVYSAPLTAQDGAELAVNDAEDVAVINGRNGKESDGELLIALEDGPAIARFTPQGKRIGGIILSAPLADREQYAKKNRRLESIAFDARYGMITTPETPLLGQPEDQHTLYATGGTKWPFKAFQPDDSNLKAIGILPDGNGLILEWTREKKGAPFVARLRHVDLADCAGKAPCSVTEMSPVPATALENNFEGMTRLSDDPLLVTDKTAKDGEPMSFTLVALNPASRGLFQN